MSITSFIQTMTNLIIMSVICPSTLEALDYVQGALEAWQTGDSQTAVVRLIWAIVLLMQED